VTAQGRMPRMPTARADHPSAITVPCATCGTPVTRFPSQITGRVYCSRACAAAGLRVHPSVRTPPSWRGPDHPSWKGGVTIARPDGRQYRYIWQPEHPHAIKKGYVLEHKLVMTQALGRPLTDDELVRWR